MKEKNYKYAVIKYVVIGGEYTSICYGCTETERQAKLLATKNRGLWDNWQGFHKPDIYNYNDTEITTVQGSIIYRDGTEIRVPKHNTLPAFYWSTISKSWVKTDLALMEFWKKKAPDESLKIKTKPDETSGRAGVSSAHQHTISKQKLQKEK